MTFFGLYTYVNGVLTKDIYDESFTQDGTWTTKFNSAAYVEGRHKTNHDITVDGFYTNIVDASNTSNIVITQDYISVQEYGDAYYDWIIGAESQTYTTTLMASVYSQETSATIDLDYLFEKGITYTISSVNVSRLNGDVSLVSPSTIPNIAESDDIANSTFGLTIQTNTGWKASKTTDIYTEDYGKAVGDINYVTDDSGNVPSIDVNFKSSTNITKNQDLGTVRISLVAKQRSGEDATQGDTFIILLNINLTTLYDEDEYKYMPSFTDRTDSKLVYTNDSQISLTYRLYKRSTSTIYDDGDYRVVSSTMELPIGTKITLIDYGLDGIDDKVYYYQITESYSDTPETYEDESQRYIYKFSEFTLMGCSDGTIKYEDDGERYYTEGSYAFEKYDVIFDFEETNISVDKYDQEIYMELRDEDNNIKYDQQDAEIKFDLLCNKNAIINQEISNENEIYTLIDNLTIENIVSDVEFYEQTTDDGTTVIDSNKRNRMLGMSIELLDGNGTRINYPEVTGFSVSVTDEDQQTSSYDVDGNGIIRINLSDNYTTLTNTLNITLIQNSLDTGLYELSIKVFASIDGKYSENKDESEYIEKKVYIQVYSTETGIIVDNVNTANRVLYKNNGKDLQGNTGLQYNYEVEEGVDENSSLRVILYKRDDNYSRSGENYQYNTVTYTEVKFADYFKNNFAVSSGNEYIVLEDLQENISGKLEFELKSNSKTGEYKILFELYQNSTCIQTVEKTFVVINE